MRTWLVFVGLVLAAPPWAAAAEPGSPAAQDWAIHAQATLVEQANAAFRSPFAGPNSLDPHAKGRETLDVTLYAGVRPWAGGEIWINPEVDQGFGLSDTLGAAGFPSGEAYKVGKAAPYLKLQRLFLRQTIDLGGDRETAPADLNQLAGGRAADRLVLTVGKFAVTDVFDTNSLAHDPRQDFLNWSVIDTGAFDYAANAWGYTVGAAAEWYEGSWTLRAGAFALSKVPNSADIDWSLRQVQVLGELERRYAVAGREGAVRLTGFLGHGRMGRFADALALARETGAPPDTALVRRGRSRGGFGVGLEQQLTGDLSAFLRAGWADGSVEPYDFTDIDGTLSGGLSVGGRPWGRDGDRWGLAAAVNRISAVHQAFLAAGGLGILVGDGALPHPGPEQIVETYYSLSARGPLRITLDYQFVRNPAYDRDRGPVSVVGLRLHMQL